MISFNLANCIQNMSDQDFTEFQHALKEKEARVKINMGIAALVNSNKEFYTYIDILSTVKGNLNSKGVFSPYEFTFQDAVWKFSLEKESRAALLYRPMGDDHLDIWIRKEPNGKISPNEAALKFSSPKEVLEFFELLCQYSWSKQN